MSAALARRIRAAVFLVTTVAATVCTVADLRWWGRPLLVLAFFLFVPGCAVISHRGLDDPLAEVTVGAALSLAIATALALLMIGIGWWQPTAAQVLLAGLATPLLIDQARNPARGLDP